MSETLKAHRPEVWRPIPSCPGYEASDQGRIKSSRGNIRKFGIVGKGYLTICVWDSQRARTKTLLVSRCVLEAFKGAPPDESMHACHGDGDKANNTPGNLRWDTPKGNDKDKIAHGTAGRGEAHSQAKLSNLQVALIRADHRMHKLIAADYGVSRSHVSSIKANCFRRHG